MKKLAAVVILVIVGSMASYFWVKSQNGFSAREDPSAPEVFVAGLMRSMSMPANAKDLKNPVFIDDKRLSSALMHWADHCATCHGNDGSGDTVIGKNLYPKPPDMRSDVTQSNSTLNCC